MKKFNSRIALMLALLSAASTAISCGGETPGGNTGDTTPAPHSAPNPYEGWVLDDLPEDLRFDGETFTIFFGYPTGSYIMEEETGDVVDDAVYARNIAVEERFGINLVMEKCNYQTDGTSQGEASSQIRTNIDAGDLTNDIYIHVQHGAMPGMIAEGYFRNWMDEEFKYFDFTKEYWYQKCLTDINYYDKVFAMTGSYNMATLTGGNCLLFNKRICDEVGKEYPYQMVKDGTWTVDEWYEYIKVGSKELNGDDKLDPNVDQTAYWGWGYESIPAFYMGLGGDTVIKKADGTPELNINNERTFTIVEKMQQVFSDPGATWEYNTWGIFTKAFEEGRLFFLHLSLGSTFRDMVDDYGYLPYPKLDLDQESYCVRVQNTTCLTYIPKTNVREEITSAVLEYMGMYTHNTVVPAFFDVTLTVKGTRDTESEEMIPIMRAACSFNDEAAGFSVASCISNGTPLASYWASQEASIKDKVQKNIIDIYGPDAD